MAHGKVCWPCEADVNGSSSVLVVVGRKQTVQVSLTHVDAKLREGLKLTGNNVQELAYAAIGQGHLDQWTARNLVALTGIHQKSRGRKPYPATPEGRAANEALVLTIQETLQSLDAALAAAALPTPLAPSLPAPSATVNEDPTPGPQPGPRPRRQQTTAGWDSDLGTDSEWSGNSEYEEALQPPLELPAGAAAACRADGPGRGGVSPGPPGSHPPPGATATRWHWPNPVALIAADAEANATAWTSSKGRAMPRPTAPPPSKRKPRPRRKNEPDPAHPCELLVSGCPVYWDEEQVAAVFGRAAALEGVRFLMLRARGITERHALVKFETNAKADVARRQFDNTQPPGCPHEIYVRYYRPKHGRPVGPQGGPESYSSTSRKGSQSGRSAPGHSKAHRQSGSTGPATPPPPPPLSSGRTSVTAGLSPASPLYPQLATPAGDHTRKFGSKWAALRQASASCAPPGQTRAAEAFPTDCGGRAAPVPTADPAPLPINTAVMVVGSASSASGLTVGGSGLTAAAPSRVVPELMGTCGEMPTAGLVAAAAGSVRVAPSTKAVGSSAKAVAASAKAAAASAKAVAPSAKAKLPSAKAVANTGNSREQPVGEGASRTPDGAVHTQYLSVPAVAKRANSERFRDRSTTTQPTPAAVLASQAALLGGGVKAGRRSKAENREEVREHSAAAPIVRLGGQGGPPPAPGPSEALQAQVSLVRNWFSAVKSAPL